MTDTQLNMKIWDALARLPESAMKTITAGRLRGKSDVNPQARYKAMTETFGPCGIGWKFTIDRIWTEPGSENQVFCFALVSVYVKVDGQWSDPVPGVGGNYLIEQETKGLHSNDEGPKMAVTDAIGTALKMIGVAAEVYLGNFSGSKYLTDPPASPPDNKRGKDRSKESFGTEPPKQEAPKPEPQKPWKSLTSAERRDRSLERIAACKNADPVLWGNALKDLSDRMGRLHADFAPEDLEKVTAALAAADDELQQECSGA